MRDSRPIRVLVADDEPLAQSNLLRLLDEEGGFDVVGTVASGGATVAAIETHSPDLVFLDIQMPGMSGFEVIERIGVDAMPDVIFVTAYDEYALRAFEVHAVDYLLKPFSRARFRAALEKAVERVRGNEARGRQRGEIVALLRELGVAEDHLSRVAVNDGERVVIVPTSDVEWIEAEAKHVRVHSRGRHYLVRESLKKMEMKLSPRMFLKVHRSAIVNVERIVEIHPWFKDTFLLILSDGTRVTTGRTYRARVLALYRNEP